MKKGNVLFLDVYDLKYGRIDEPIQNLCLSDFEEESVLGFYSVDTVIYNDIVHTIVLKNRYGKTGEVKNVNI